MNTLKRFVLLISFIYVTGCASVGPSVLIETPEPAEDFVVLCEWFGGPGIIAGGGSRESYKVFVTESGKQVDCGLGFSSRTQLRTMHPVYTSDGKSDYEKDGVKHIVMNKTKLDLLEEQQAKFEAGYWDKLPVPVWDKDKTPAQRYARSIGGCGFGHQYLEYYSQAKKVDKQYFYNKYNNFFLECNNRTYKEMFENDPTLKRQVLGAKKRMDSIWNVEKWRLYE